MYVIKRGYKIVRTLKKKPFLLPCRMISKRSMKNTLSDLPYLVPLRHETNFSPQNYTQFIH